MKIVPNVHDLYLCARNEMKGVFSWGPYLCVHICEAAQLLASDSPRGNSFAVKTVSSTRLR